MGKVSTRVHDAAEILNRGGVVAIPTETVYGLAARADNPQAVRRVFDIKGRPHTHPLIVHVADAHAARRYGELTESAIALVNVLWPGPLTIVVPRGPLATDDITGGLATVAIRVPSHPRTRELLESLDCGLVAPSANRFGMVSPTCAEHVERDLDNDVDLILDGGPCDIGVESTIVDCTVDPVQVLRPGAISEEAIERILLSAPAEARGPSRAPGMLASHYAPTCAVELFESPGAAEHRARELTNSGVTNRIVDRCDDSLAYARHLYSDLRTCDNDGIDVALFVLPEPTGIGLAIRDRLAKAAAPRTK